MLSKTNVLSGALDAAVNKAKNKGRHYLTDDEFMEVIAPSFRAVDELEDMRAVLERTHFIVCGDNYVLFRQVRVCSGDAQVKFFEYEGGRKVLLSEQVCVQMGKYRENMRNEVYPEDFMHDAAFSRRLMMKLKKREPIPLVMTISGPDLFGNRRLATQHMLGHDRRNMFALPASTSSSSAPSSGSAPSSSAALAPASPVIKIKKEITDEQENALGKAVVWSCELKSGANKVINLDTPSPPRKKMKSTCSNSDSD